MQPVTPGSPLTNLTSTITNDTVFINNPTVPASYTVTGTAANGCISSAVSQVTTSTNLGILSGSPESACFGSFVGLSALGASTYTWTTSDPANLSFLPKDTTWAVTASVANVGTYSVYIYGESHSGTYCNGRDTVILTINPTPTVTTVLSPTTAICSGSTATITASGAATYTWISPSTTSLTPTPNTFVDAPVFTANYTVTGSNAFGCTSSAITTISVTPVPSFTVNSPNACLGSSFDSLKVSPNTATSYSWSAGLSSTTGTFVTFNTNTVGTNTYSVFATETDYSISCSSSPVTVTVTVNPVPVITITVNPVSDTICAGNSATLTASGATTYTWTSTSTTSLTPSPNVFIDAPVFTDTYTVSGTSLGCTSTTTANIVVNNAPTFSYTGVPSLAMCAGGTDTLEVTPTYTNSVNPSPTYSWTSPPNGGLSTNTGTFVTVTPTGTVGFGGYTYTVVATSGSCQFTHHVHVTVHNPPTLIPTPDTTICGSQPITLNANPQGGGFGGGNTYTWTPSSINTSTTTTTVTPPVGTNTYAVQSTSGNGCVSMPGTVTITVNPVPNFTVNNTNPTFCIGGSSTLTAVPTSTVAATYAWTPPTGLSSTSNTVVTATPSLSTTYVVVATATVGGCTTTNNVLVTVDVPPVLNPITTNTVICLGQPVTLNANPIGGSGGVINYSWTPTGANSASITETPTVAGTFPYSVQASVGTCISNIAIITVSVSPVPTVTASVGPACLGQPIDLTTTVTGSPTSYSWTSSTGFSSSSANPIIANGSSANTGSYTVTISLGSCSSSSIVSINVSTPPTLTVTPTNTVVCPNTATNFTATSSTATSYSWSPLLGVTGVTLNESVVSIASANSNTYVVTGIDATTGCTSTKVVTLNIDPITASFIPSLETGNAPLNVIFD